MCEKEEMLPISNPLTIFKNADFQFTVIMYDINGDPIDWTGIVFIGQIRAKDNTDGTPVATFAFDAGASDGKIIGRLTKATVGAITNKNCYYDVKATELGQEFPLIKDDIKFEEGNTV